MAELPLPRVRDTLAAQNQQDMNELYRQQPPSVAITTWLRQHYLQSNAMATLTSVYDAAEEAGLADFEGAYDPTQDGQAYFKRAIRNVLQREKIAGRWSSDGRGNWVRSDAAFFVSNHDIDDHSDLTPYRSILFLNGKLCDVSLSVQSAVAMFNEANEQFDFAILDPPFGIDADQPGYANHAHDEGAFIDGYVETADFEALMEETLVAAMAATRFGGTISVMTGADQSHVVGYVSDKLGLTRVDRLIQPHPFPTYTTRRHSPDYWVINTLCVGPLNTASRTFNHLPELPRSKKFGNVHSRSIWPDDPLSSRKRVKNGNSIPTPVANRAFRAYSNRGDNTAVPFAGEGTFVREGVRLGRRVTACDLNPGAIKLTELLAMNVFDQLDTMGLNRDLVVPDRILPARAVLRGDLSSQSTFTL